MPHRDTSEWDDDLIAYAKACWGAVPCEKHPNCLRDAADDEVCERVRQNLFDEIKAMVDRHVVISCVGKVRS